MTKVLSTHSQMTRRPTLAENSMPEAAVRIRLSSPTASHDTPSPSSPPRRGQYETFPYELNSDARRACTHHLPHCHFGSSPQEARSHQVSHIDTGTAQNQQCYHEKRAQEQDQPVLEIFLDSGGGTNSQREVAVDLGKLLHQLASDRFDVGPGLHDLEPRSQAGNQLDPFVLAVLRISGGEVCHRTGKEDVKGKSHKMAAKAFRCDSDNGEGLSVEANLLPQNRLLASKLSLPKALADHGHSLSPGD